MVAARTSAASWRAMAPADIPQVAAIAAEVHPGFFEDEAVFAERQQLFPAGAALLELAGEAVGYVLSHPWLANDPPPLNCLLGGIPESACTYYIHDLALLPRARGARVASRVVDSLMELADSLSYPSMTLVAVNGSRRFWEKNGFRAIDCAALSDRLRSYEASAVLMTRSLRR